jgi:acetyltransferase-like isoleucine patch superfamily enzyme
MSPRVRRIAARAIHRAWAWASAVGTLTPDDDHGFRLLGPQSMLAFPPGDVFGRWWISIGARTLVGPEVSLGVGLPGEVLEPSAPPVITIGERSFIGRGSSVIGRLAIDIGNDVTIAPNVYITDHNHTYADVDVPIGQQYPTHERVRIGDGSWLGVGVTVLPGTSIGRHVTVAAGAVVRGDVPDHAVVAGNPARVVRRLEGGAWVPPLRRSPDDPPPDWPA